MPFADRIGVVTVLQEDLRQHPILEWDIAVTAGVATGTFGDAGHAVRVMIAPSDKTGARRRSQRRRMHIIVEQPVSGERVQIRCINRTTVATELAEAGVVENN